ncbi:MAG: TRL domain-containing protein [Planctomycetota bacterium]
MLRKTCATLLLAIVPTMQGCLYADVTTPLDTDLYNTELGDKTGESSNYGVMGLVAWGDGGTKAAADEGGITTITHADQRIYQILWGLYTKRTTIVYGK